MVLVGAVAVVVPAALEAIVGILRAVDDENCRDSVVVSVEVVLVAGFVEVVGMDDSTVERFQYCSLICGFVSKNWWIICNCSIFRRRQILGPTVKD